MKELLSIRRTFLAVLFLGLFAMAARTVTDADVWWHLKTGQYIAAHKAVPHADPFSYTRAGQPWVAHEWLTELLFYGLYRSAGWGGLIVAFAAIPCLAFFLLYLRCADEPYVAGVVTLCAAWATVPTWGVRPQVVSLLLTSLWLLILERSEPERSERGRSGNDEKLLWWTLPILVLWVNLHAGFALGLALLALFLVGESLECLPRSPRCGNPKRRLRALALALLLNLLLVPLNPNGMRMFSYPLETLRSKAMQNYIAEWASPNFHHAEYWPFLLLLLAAIAALGWSSLRVRPRDVLLLLAGTYAALSSIRLIPLFVLIAAPLISVPLKRWTESDQPSAKPRSSSGDWLTAAALNALIVLAMGVFAVIRVAQAVDRQPKAEADRFPAGAVAFLQTHPPRGPIFNHYDWGGYLIWRLYPSERVFIDGRADLYGGQLLDQFAATYQLKGDWRQTLNQWGIRTVLVPADSALATGLRIAPG